MKKSFISLFLLTLILSHFSILNLWASGQLRRIWKYAAMILLCLTVGLGEMWGAHQYILPVTSTTSYGGSSVERKIDNNTWVVYEANNSDNWVDFHLNVASANNYFFYVGVSSDREGNFRPFTNNTQRGVHGFSNSGWNNVRETNCGTNGVLQAGDNKISIRNNGNNFNLYYIRLADAINTNLTVPSDLGIYFWEVDGGTKTVNNSDFSYSNNSDYMDYNGYSGKVAFKSSPTTATSRYNMVFPTTGKYQFIFPVYVKDNGTYSYPTVRVNSKSTASGSITTVENNKLDSIILELDVSAGTYPIYIDFPATDKVFYRYVSVIEKPASCTAPNHVDVTATAEVGNYGWRYSIGETLKLTATPYSSAGTGSPIDDEDITGYQWQKYVGSTWTDLADDSNISGATTANLQISNLTTSNGGSYRCNISTGACSKSSDGYFVRIFTLYGGYSGGSYTHNKITWTGEKRGTVTINLNASQNYKFKFTDNDGKWYGNGGTISEDFATEDDGTWGFGTSADDATLSTGAYGGDFVLTVDITHFDDGGSKYVNLRSVVYPRKKIYVVPNGYTDGNAKLSIYYWRSSNGWSDFLTSDACSDGKYYGEIPGWAQYFSIVRLNSDATVGTWDKKWNQTGDITANGSYNQYTVNTWCSGDNCKEGTTAGTYSPTTYTISFEGNGSTSGSMTSISSIACDADQAITANAFEKTGYSFANWTANVDVKINDATVSAGNAIANSATIQNIRSNITLTAQWSVNNYDLTWDLAGGTTSSAGTGIASGVSATTTTSQTYGTSLTAPTVTKTGYNFSAWSPAVAGTMPAANTTYTATWTAKTTSITLDDNDENYGSTSSSVTATWGSVLPAFTATEGVSGYRLKGYYTAKTDGTKIINADGSLVANTDYATNDATPVWKYVGGSVTFYPQYDLVDNMVISGASNTVADTPGPWSGNGGSLTITSGNSDVTCGFDHNVLKIDYSGMTGSAYASQKVAPDAGYSSSLSDGATGFGFYYKTSSSTDAVAFCLEYQLAGDVHQQSHVQLPATNGVWKYVYMSTSYASGWSSHSEIGAYLAIFLNASWDTNTTTYASGTFYIADLKATGVTSKSDISNTAHTVSVSSNNDSYGTASGGGSYYDCNSVTVTAAPESGYSFVNWKQGGSEVSTDEDYTFTMEDLRGDASSVTLVANFEEVNCSSSRTYQVEDILIAAGSVTCNDAQADGANTLVVNSTTNTSSSHYSDYMNNESGPYGGGYVMNTAASKTIYMEVDIPLAGSYDIALWYGKNNGGDKVEWLNIYTRTWTSYTTLTYGGNTYYKLENDGYKVSSTASSSYYISTTPYEKKKLSLPAGKIVIGIWSEYANAVYDQIRITHHDDSDVFCKHDITVNNTSGASGSATASVSKALAGETVTVTAAAASDGYNFTGWTVTSGTATFADASSLSTTFVMPDADVTVQANYASSGYTVTYEVVGEHGTISSVVDGSSNPVSSGGRVADGTLLTFTAAPAEGYAVLGWYTWLNSTETLQGNTQNNNTFTYTVTQDITIRVKFDTPYTLTLTSSPAAASATVSGGGSYVKTTVVSVSTSTENGDYTFVHWMDGESEVSTNATFNYVMPEVTKTLNAVYRQSRISSLSWSGSEDLGSGIEVASSCFDGGCFDTDVTFTFTEGGTVNYYDNINRSSPLGTVTSGTAITLTDALRANGIYIKCTSGAATLTAVSKTTIGSVYQIWSAAGSNLGAVEVGYWSQQVVLGPEHFQTAIVGDVLRVNTSDEDDGGSAQGALQYILTEGDSHTYKGLDNYTDGGLHNWDLSDEQKSQHYFEITINATHLANLKRYGAIVKGRYYTIQSVELRASCSNRSMRTTAPDITRYADVNIMTTNIDFGEGFTLGNWEHKLELDESCFTSVTVGSVINLYMSVDGDATLSFRCNVDSVHAKSYGEPPLCPSYGDISFDRTIDDLYGDAPAVVGATEGYKVLYLLVDADMRRRLQETGMILCGKGTLIKVVEGVPDTVVVNSNEERHVPTVVNNLTIYQGGQVTNTDDIEVLGKITYIRPAKGGKLGNRLDQWYTFALPFTVSDVEVYDVADERWYDINAVYYLSDATDQATNDPDGAGHYYLQYLKAENETAIGKAFAARWQYITPGHSLACVSEWVANNGTRYGYPKKDEAYIILFDSKGPGSDLIGYWDSNPTIRFVGVGPQTIDGVAKEWKVEADGEQYWMYANNTLHSFTLNDAYILNDAGTEFVLQESPTIRPFECYVQATESLKDKYAAIPMRGFRIDNTTTGAESIQGSAIRAEKILRNGQLIIIRNGVEYDATGVVIR